MQKLEIMALAKTYGLWVVPQEIRNKNVYAVYLGCINENTTPLFTAYTLTELESYLRGWIAKSVNCTDSVVP